MRVSDSDRFSNHNPHSFSVPLHNGKKEVDKKLIAQEIWRENSKRLAKKKKPKPLRVLPPTPPIEKISDRFLAALRWEKDKQKRRKYYYNRQRPVMKYAAEMKKEVKKYGDMQNPEYKTFNMYRHSAFMNHLLMRSNEGLTVKEAWILLIKCWIGFKQSSRAGNERGMRYYGKGIQKYTYLLEEVQPDFSSIGLKPYKDIF